MKTNLFDNAEVSDEISELDGELHYSVKSHRIDDTKSREIDDVLLFPLRSCLLDKCVALNILPYLMSMDRLLVLFFNQVFLTLLDPTLEVLA